MLERGDEVVVERIPDRRLAEAVASVAGRRHFETVVLCSLDAVALGGLSPASIPAALALTVPAVQ